MLAVYGRPCSIRTVNYRSVYVIPVTLLVRRRCRTLLNAESHAVTSVILNRVYSLLVTIFDG